MKTKKEILEQTANSDDRLFLSKIIDIATRSEKINSPVSSQFCNGHELVLAQNALTQLGVCFSVFGGYDGCERSVVCCCPEYQEPEFPVAAIKVTGRDVGSLTHRDYLGALMGLGIRREKIGDIITHDDCGYILCMADLAPFIVGQVDKIGRIWVKMSECELDDIVLPEKRYKEITATVSSLRLDAVISAATGCSRGDAADYIKAGRVSVGWIEATSVSREVHPGELLSVKGFGRMELAQVGGVTRKGRTVVIIKVYQ